MSKFALVLTLSVGSVCASGALARLLALEYRPSLEARNCQTAQLLDRTEPVSTPLEIPRRPVAAVTTALPDPGGFGEGESPDPNGGPIPQSPDFFETLADGSLPEPQAIKDTILLPRAVGPIAPASGQPAGALAGRIVFTSAGHGWTAGSSSWALGRPLLLEMNEDYGNLDQMTMFATYCFNAGATVVPFRPIGFQTNEVLLDNDDAGVTFAGSWSVSTSTIFYGSAGDAPYRFATVAASETATATYVPSIPVAGFYPVYTWVRHGSDRTSQLYRIRHTGGESLVRVPHYMVGNGWVYLGTYYFNASDSAALGAVVISNLQPTPNVGTVVIADAIRFGNGMGDVDRGFGVSSYPREEECSRYWVHRALGQGQSSSLYDGSSTDTDDNVGTPPRMAREMNRETSENMFKRVYIGFHSNAGGGRGVTGLYNNDTLFTGTSTPNQVRLAQLTGLEINNDLVGIGTPPLEVGWYNRGSSVTYARSDYAFGEIRGDTLNQEMDATIIEVAFHDDASDAKLMRDPKVRDWVARASYQAVVRYMNQFDGLALNFLPEPPGNVRAIAATNGIVVSWTPPVAQAGSGTAAGYVVYRSTDGYGFGEPVAVSGVGTLSMTLTNLGADTDFFVRVAAMNAGGESLPSETVACRRASDPATKTALLVNGFDRFDRFINLRQTPSGNYKPPGHSGNSGTIDRVMARGNNAFDYVVPHAKAVSSSGLAYDSCQNEAVASGLVGLAAYPIVIWASGQESTSDETFSSLEQARVIAYLIAGGSLFVSGSDIAYDLDRASGPTAADRSFLNNWLHAHLSSDAQDNSLSYTFIPGAYSIFAGNSSADFDDGTKGIYAVRTPDVLTPDGVGTIPALSYRDGLGGAAAIQYDGSAGGGRVVLLGSPFETIVSGARRDEFMADILAFLSLPPATNLPPSILTPPENQRVVVGSNATLIVAATGTLPLHYQWRFNGVNLAGATANTLTRCAAQFVHSGNYDVVVSNVFGVVTSAPVAVLTVTLPPELQSLFVDLFDTNSLSRWTVNRPSSDTRVTFNYDYSTDGIQAAPGSGGTTRGVKFEANMSVGAAAALSISPVGQAFAGDYRLRFNLWMNANGPFPEGGTGSTQHGTAGLGTAGNRVQWTGSGSIADGYWFAVDGEGQASDTSTTSINDFCAFSGTTSLSASSGVYAAGTASDARGNLNGYYTTAFPGGQAAPVWQQTTYPLQQHGGLAAGTIGFAWREVILNKSGNAVEWFIDGVPIATIRSATFTASNICLGYWDSFASLSDNPELSFGLVDNVRVERVVTNAPPFITTHPTSATVTAGHAVSFNVAAGGTPPLAYQWQRNETNLPGATANSYTLEPAQMSATGSYSVLVSNVAGTVTSSNALLTVLPPTPLKFDRLALQPNGALSLWLSAEPGIYAIESSPTLTHWDFVASVTNLSGTFEFISALATNSPTLFYRARQQAAEP